MWRLQLHLSDKFELFSKLSMYSHYKNNYIIVYLVLKSKFLLKINEN